MCLTLLPVHGCRLVQDESRWEREIGRLQQVAAADLQRIRQEASEAAEREGRLLRYGHLTKPLEHDAGLL